MPKPLRVAGEIDSWCTRCRLVLNHRIVSMKAGKAHQVECLTCRAQHLWRAHAPGERPRTGASADARGPGGRLTGLDGARASSAASGRPPRMTHAARHEQQWEKAIAGKAVSEFKPYNVGGSFREGDLVRHKKFGDGVVTRVIDEHKVEVLFRDEARTLAQGMA
ncbi:MAG TPA: hypothetical protein VE987_00955 [Polyangiaceae bacterium]|nr:hypothetical protein [Polyangiaceae bacterium]